MNERICHRETSDLLPSFLSSNIQFALSDLPAPIVCDILIQNRIQIHNS